MKYVILAFAAYYIYTSTSVTTEDYTYDADNVDAVVYGPPNYQLYEYMKRYSEEYDIPFGFALNCAKEETGFRGKFDFKYRPFVEKLRRSYADAYGPLQVQIPTANEMWEDRTITPDDLGYDIKLNVITSFRYKRYLYNIYGDWTKVYSVYNQGWKGSRNINTYARNITGITHS